MIVNKPGKHLENIILYGAGNRCKVLVELLRLCEIPIAHIVDGDSRVWGLDIGGHPIESPDIIRENPCASICITVSSFLGLEEIREKIVREYGYEAGREITYCSLIMEIYEILDSKGMFIQEEVSFRNELAILFDCEFGIGLGGIEEWTKGICREFVERRDYPAYILTNFGENDVPEELADRLLQIDVKRENAFSVDNVRRVLNCISSHLPCILVTSQPDEVLIAGWILKRQFGEKLRVISGIRGGYSEISKNYMAMRSCTDLYVCVNSEIREAMIARGVERERIYTMLCPISCPEELARCYTLDRNRPIRLGYAGRLEVEEKRLDLMLRVIEELEKKQVDYYAEFAGEGRYEEFIERFMKEEGRQEKIRLVGRIGKDSIPEFWADKDICLNTSDHEGRSRSTIEAMASGTVPIVTETSGVHDDIVSGANGFIVGVGDYKAMAERIAFLEENRKKLAEFGEKAYREIKEKSSMDDHYRFWLDKIQEVLGQENR